VTRIVSPDYALEAEKPSITMVCMVEVNYDSGTVRVHDGIGSIVLGGNILTEAGEQLDAENDDNLINDATIAPFYGIGDFGGIESVEENIEVVARQVTLTCSGLDSTWVTPALTEDYQNRTVTVYLGFFSPDTGALIGSPEVIWEGRINQQTITLSKGDATLSMTCEHRLRREPRIARYTQADQELLHTGDRFFDLTHTIEGFVNRWGRRDVGYGGGGGGGNRGPGSGDPGSGGSER
jgi:hypothetical protein